MRELGERDRDQQQLDAGDMHDQHLLVPQQDPLLQHDAGQQWQKSECPGQIILVVGDQALDRVGVAVHQQRDHRGDRQDRRDRDQPGRQRGPAEAQYRAKQLDVLAQQQQRDQESQMEDVAGDQDETAARGQVYRDQRAVPHRAQARPPFRAARGSKVLFAAEHGQVEHAVDHAEHEYRSGDLQAGPAYEIQPFLLVHAPAPS